MALMRSLLIANRGEIAVRIIRTARRLGVRTIAVYSDADRTARHVAMADAAEHLGPAAATESYLHVPAVLAAARRSGAEAIHPGYGFLSENADFAVACHAAGLVFVGPQEHALRVMGSKSAAKQAVAAAGVPVLAGYLGERQDDSDLQEEAERIGYPLLVKAIAGGGGKGMRVVRETSLLVGALQAARREARAAFGDDRVMLERFVERPRHVEVQIFGDRNGNLVHLFERDCSLQRRHQKVIEEAPAPGLSDALRGRLHRQAVAAARAVNYEGAGTVEFLCEGDDAWFIEMNTRLQVEHPVTEMITGLDLVEWQLRVASGETLPLRQEQIRAQGHAIELRLCAEDPSRGLLPSTGVLDHFELAGLAAPWRRFDTGFARGDRVTPHYDSMLAKLIVKGPDRATAIERADSALRDLRIAGVATNLAFLAVLLRSQAWRNGSFDTNLISREHDGLLAQAAAAMAMPAEIRALLAVALLCADDADSLAGSPWSRRDGYTPNLPRQSWLWGLDGDQPVRLLPEGPAGWRVCWPDGADTLLTDVAANRHSMQADIAGRRWRGQLLRQADACTWMGPEGSFTLARRPREIAAAAVAGAALDGLVSAPMPGQVLALHVAVGQRVERGARLVTLEAMKMEHTLTAPGPAVVRAVECRPGQRVQEGAALLRLDPA